MSVSAQYVSQLSVTYTSTNPFVGADNTLTFNGLNQSLTLDGTTTPAVTKFASFAKALSTGTGTIDLTLLPGQTADEVVTFTTLKVRAFKFVNPATNTGAITIVNGASSGNFLLGAAFTLVVPLGGEVTMYLKAGSVTVDNTHKTLDLTGTGSDVLDVLMVAG